MCREPLISQLKSKITHIPLLFVLQGSITESDFFNKPDKNTLAANEMKKPRCNKKN